MTGVVEMLDDGDDEIGAREEATEEDAAGILHSQRSVSEAACLQGAALGSTAAGIVTRADPGGPRSLQSQHLRVLPTYPGQGPGCSVVAPRCVPRPVAVSKRKPWMLGVGDSATSEP